jgi:hypothetical protein
MEKLIYIDIFENPISNGSDAPYIGDAIFYKDGELECKIGYLKDGSVNWCGGLDKNTKIGILECAVLKLARIE